MAQSAAAGLYDAPAAGQFVIDPASLLSEPLRESLLANLTKFNRTSKGQQQCYLAIYPRTPPDEEKVLTPREFARRLLRSWFVKTEKIVLIVLLVDNKRVGRLPSLTPVLLVCRHACLTSAWSACPAQCRADGDRDGLARQAQAQGVGGAPHRTQGAPPTLLMQTCPLNCHTTLMGRFPLSVPRSNG